MSVLSGGAIVIILLAGLSFQAVSASLTTDLQKFDDVIAYEDFAAPFLNTYQDDEKFARSADYLVSFEFNKLLDEMVESIYFEEYLHLLMEHGVPAVQWLEKMRAVTRRPPFPVPHPPQLNSQNVDKDFMPFIYNMMPYFILTDIKDVYFYLSRTSVSLMEVLALLKTDEYQNTLSFLMESPQYQAVMDGLSENGIDVGKIYEHIAREFEMVDF